MKPPDTPRDTRRIWSSLSWVNPKVIESRELQALNQSRNRMCRHSPFWSIDFDIRQHQKEWAAGEERRQAQIATYRRLAAFEPPPTRPGLDNHVFVTIGGPVLGHETIFCPHWQEEKFEIAPWPRKSEMQYEGDGRMSTDRLHRRYPGLPRIEGNETVNWQQRAPIPPAPFDDFYYPIPHEVEVFMRTHWVAELEFSDEEGQEAIGKGLMRLLDPEDQW